MLMDSTLERSTRSSMRRIALVQACAVVNQNFELVKMFDVESACLLRQT
jgi:hypothetical protein